MKPHPSTEAYFGQGYYALYRHWLLPAEQTQAEAGFLCRVLKPKPGQRWLDVPCGYGRHLMALKRLAPGLRLWGVELNRGYLAERGLKRAARRIAANMCRLPLASGSFDVVINMLNSFGYGSAAGDAQTLAEWARVLARGGRLLMDLPNRQALLAIVRRQPMVRYCGGDYEAVEEFEWDADAQCLLNQTRWRWPGGGEEAGYRLRLSIRRRRSRACSRATALRSSARGATSKARLSTLTSLIA